MKPSQPDDAGSPSPGKPPRSGQKPLPPAVVYALDCLERATATQVRRHMASLGYASEEAAEAVRAALAHRSGDGSSAWSRTRAMAPRRCACRSASCLFVYATASLPSAAA